MEMSLDILWLLLLGFGLLAGGLLAVFQLPGTWFILLCAVAYAWAYDFVRVEWATLIILAAMAVVAETAEFIAAMKGAQKFGASRAASWGALIGGFCGMIVLTPLIPIPVVGSVCGGLLGCFAGALVVEYRRHGDSRVGMKVGVGALLGRLVGLMIKLFTAVLMAGMAFASGVSAFLEIHLNKG